MSALILKIEYIILYTRYLLFYLIYDFKQILRNLIKSITGAIENIAFQADLIMSQLHQQIQSINQNASDSLDSFINAHHFSIVISLSGYIGVSVLGYLIIAGIRKFKYKELSKKNIFLRTLFKTKKIFDIKKIFKKDYLVYLKKLLGKSFAIYTIKFLFFIWEKIENFRFIKENRLLYSVFAQAAHFVFRFIDMFGILIEKGLVALRIIRLTESQETLFLVDIATVKKNLTTEIPKELLDEFHYSEDSNLKEYLDFSDVYRKPLMLALEKWNSGLLSSMLLIGKKGCGKTALINLASEVLTPKTPVYKIDVQQVSDRNNALAQSIALFENHHNKNIKNKSKSIIVLDNLHYLFVKNQTDFTVYNHLLSLIANSNTKILCIATINECSYNFISQFLPIADTFDFKISLNMLKEKQIKRIFLNKVSSRGFTIQPRLSPSQLKRVKKKIKKGEISYAELQDYILDEYFGKLYEKCENIFPALFHYFLHSIDNVSANRIIVSEANFTDITFAENLNKTYYFILTAIMIHSSLSEKEISSLVSITVSKLQVYLSFLVKNYLLEQSTVKDEAYYTINALNEIQLSKILKSKYYLYF